MPFSTLVKPLLFSFPPERAHYLAMDSFKVARKIPIVKEIWKAGKITQDPKLERELFGLKFPNPVGLAAGFDKDARYIDELDSLGFGFIEIGTLTPKGQPGNPKPRIFRLVEDEALINRLGFNNQGVEAAVERLKSRKSSAIIGGNIGKNKITPNQNAHLDYLRCYEVLRPLVDYFTINVSSPNTPGLRDLQTEEGLKSIFGPIIEQNEKGQRKPLLLKIAPDILDEDLDAMLKVIEEFKLDGIIATNTTLDRSNLKKDTLEVEKIGAGGVSGAPLKNASTDWVKKIHQKTDARLPIIAVGGIFSSEDVWEKLQAGASLVQIYTGFIYRGPTIVTDICKDLVRRY